MNLYGLTDSLVDRQPKRVPALSQRVSRGQRTLPPVFAPSRTDRRRRLRERESRHAPLRNRIKTELAPRELCDGSRQCVARPARCGAYESAATPLIAGIPESCRSCCRRHRETAPENQSIEQKQNHCAYDRHDPTGDVILAREETALRTQNNARLIAGAAI
jgi:hypothetical protein